MVLFTLNSFRKAKQSTELIMEIMKQLHEAVCKKQPELWPINWILQHNNAPAYKELSIKQFLAQKSITEMEHPPYSPDLALHDFWLFPKIKSALKGQRFQDMKTSKQNVTALTADQGQELQKCFQQW